MQLRVLRPLRKTDTQLLDVVQKAANSGAALIEAQGEMRSCLHVSDPVIAAEIVKRSDFASCSFGRDGSRTFTFNQKAEDITSMLVNMLPDKFEVVAEK